MTPINEQIHLDSFIESEMSAWNVPGCAVAVVRDDSVLHSRSYGLRDVDERQPVTPSTLFAIGSLTKSFTAATLVALARVGKLDLDRPVREYLADFHLWDEDTTARITARDLLTHQSGLPAHDLVWDHSPLTRDEIYHRLRFLQPSYGLREAYQYNNLMYMVAGALAGTVAESSWERAVTTILLAPLGMNRTGFAIRQIDPLEELARPYRLNDDGQPQAIEFRNDDMVAPAGAMVAPIDELVGYVRMLLANGQFEGREVLAREDVDALLTENVVVPAGAKYSDHGSSHYGLGFLISSYRGHTNAYHGGNCEGFSALISLLPDIRAGVIVLSNVHASRLPAVVACRALDQLLALDPIPWGDRYREYRTARIKAQQADEADQPEREQEGLKPPRARGAYTGKYRHPAYGYLEVRTTDETTERAPLAIDYHGFSTRLSHVNGDLFESPADSANRLERLRVTFKADPLGTIKRVEVPFEPRVDDIVFERVTDPTPA